MSIYFPTHFVEPWMSMAREFSMHNSRIQFPDLSQFFKPIFLAAEKDVFFGDEFK
jgi:hypothetical protein